jgi:HSP20 family protein
MARGMHLHSVGDRGLTQFASANFWVFIGAGTLRRDILKSAKELEERRIAMSHALQKNRLGHLLPGSLPELDNLFNHFFRAEEVGMWRAPASIWEADDTFHIEVDAPGVKKDDVELTFNKGALQITLERKAPEGERTNWHNERGYGKVSRSVSLPETVDPDTITAEFTNGVLHVTITKLPEAQPKKIEVRVS